MTHYYYEGPVVEFNECICDYWYGETFAVSEKKARSNLAYQFKKQTNRTPDTKISLPGEIREF